MITNIKDQSQYIKLFRVMYDYGRPDLPTLHHASGVSWSMSTLRRYIYDLQRQSFIHLFYGNSCRPPIVALRDKGFREYAHATDKPVHRITDPRHTDAERIRDHDAGLAKYLYARDLHWQGQSDLISVGHRDLFHQCLNDTVRNTHRLKVAFKYKGEEYTYSVKPDDVSLTGQVGEGTFKLSVTEFDTGSEALMPKKFKTHPANIYAKIISYVALLEQDKFAEYLGEQDATIDFVTLSDRRRDGIYELVQKIVPPDLQHRFRVATAPTCPTEDAEAYAHMVWYESQTILHDV